MKTSEILKNIIELPKFSEKQLKALSAKFKERRNSDNKKSQMVLAVNLKVNLNDIINFEKIPLLPGKYDSVRAVVNYALTGEFE